MQIAWLVELCYGGVDVTRNGMVDVHGERQGNGNGNVGESIESQ